MTRRTLIVLAICVSARAETTPVYFDYLEDGKLTGGRIMVDLSDPGQRAAFGFDSYGVAVVWPVTTLVDNGEPGNRIDLVMLGDGYTASEIGQYADHVDAVLSLFLVEHPLAAYVSYFNVHRVDVVSNESGVDEPDNGIYRDTALDMTYYCAGIPRLLCINQGKAVAAAANAPDTDQILALANSTRYGGGGFVDLCTLAGNSSAAVELALHEFGHSFVGLADEYDYGDGATYTGPEPSEPNVGIYDEPAQTALQTKWYLWMDLPNVSTFEGAMYNQYGLFRPTTNSKMRSLSRPFEEINVEQFILTIYQTVSPIDSVTPDSADPLPGCSVFQVVPMQPVSHALDVQWTVDGAAIPGATGTTFSADTASLTPGVHEVGVTVTDNTSEVRDEVARGLWMTDERVWQIVVPSSPDECAAAVPAVSGYMIGAMLALLTVAGVLVLQHRQHCARAR
ncbi:MAG: M64 family metallopeptidase [Phycisphaerae bacterium]